jgi:hypothetical protein
MPSHPRLLALPALLVLLALGSACGAASEEATERMVDAAVGSDADVDLDDGQVSIETEDGSFSTGGGEVPETWPEDIPLPDLEDITSSEVQDASGAASVTLTGRTDLSVDEAEAFFAEALESWTQASRSAVGTDVVQVIYDLGDRSVLVGITDDGDAVTITLTHIDETGGGSADALGITDAGDALDSAGLESKARAMESALGEDEVDRIEVDGDTIHVYLKGGTFDPMMGCIVASGVLSDGEKAVMHLDGEATPCD